MSNKFNINYNYKIKILMEHNYLINDIKKMSLNEIDNIFNELKKPLKTKDIKKYFIDYSEYMKVLKQFNKIQYF